MLVIINLPVYMCAKHYQNSSSFDKVIAKIKWCSFFDSHGSLILLLFFRLFLYNFAVGCSAHVSCRRAKSVKIRNQLSLEISLH